MPRRLFFLWCALFFFIASATARALPDFTEIVEKQGSTVVNISTTQIVRNNNSASNEDDPFFDFFRRFLNPQAPNSPREFASKSLGSGFIISQDGYILTNAHVVESADEVLVRLNDKREFKARLIGSDRRTDIALLKIEAMNLPRAPLGEPSRLRVGEWVVAIGTPFGFDNTVTAGIVSAKGRSLPQENYVPFIQTDVAINPGNSGGPLFNLRGEVVGINSQIYSRSGGFMGISFAIPIDVAMDVVRQLRENGKVSRGRMGVTIQEITRELAETLNLPKTSGSIISLVERGGPADRAGLEAGDVVLKFDGKAINNANDLPRWVASSKPNTRIALQIWRKGSVRDVSVVIGEAVDERHERRLSRARPEEANNRLGVLVGELSSTQKRQHQLDGGVVVLDTQGPSARAGIRRGDFILAVGNHAVRNVDQFNQIISSLRNSGTIALLVKRDDSTIYVPVRLSEK